MTPATPLPLVWTPDILPGFEQTTLVSTPAADGPIEIVLVRRRVAAGQAAVLYIHGFIDYFFQTHLADFYGAQGLHFYALDLRRHGRSLRPHQLPNTTADIDEYLDDVATLNAHEEIDWLLVNGHSTGGLVAALHAHRGAQRDQVDAVFLNSPFLDMNIPAWQARLLEPLVAAVGGLLPKLRLPDLSPVYAQSIHADFHGEWRFDTRWKPINGFPIYAGWFRAIHRAQDEMARGLNIDCPCLVLHAERSLR
ncbi:MAG TPA: alpha/beta hydrolase, partial [Rhodocyclaceae bacterium]|nr:alpha/beta hydrolase [Rhodocyclaceae bacterium]